MKPTSNIDILLQCLYVALPKKGREGPQTENVLSHYFGIPLPLIKRF